VDVYSPVEHFELNCPPAVEANQEFCCPVSVHQGSNMYLEAKFAGGSEVSTPLDGKMMICLTVAPFSVLTPGLRYPSDSFPQLVTSQVQDVTNCLTFHLVITRSLITACLRRQPRHCSLRKRSSALVISSLLPRLVVLLTNLFVKYRTGTLGKILRTVGTCTQLYKR